MITALIALVATIALPAAPMKKTEKGGSPEGAWSAGADSRKADYIYMEAMRQNALGNDDSFFELLRRSIDLDSTDTQPGLTLGYFYMALGQEDTLLATKGYEMMRRHFNAHPPDNSPPSDYYSSIFYGMVNSQLGNTGEAIRVWGMMADSFPDKPDIALKLAQSLQQSNDSANLRRSIDVLSGIERAGGKDLGRFEGRWLRRRTMLPTISMPAMCLWCLTGPIRR